MMKFFHIFNPLLSVCKRIIVTKMLLTNVAVPFDCLYSFVHLCITNIKNTFKFNRLWNRKWQQSAVRISQVLKLDQWTMEGKGLPERCYRCNSYRDFHLNITTQRGYAVLSCSQAEWRDLYHSEWKRWFPGRRSVFPDSKRQCSSRSSRRKPFDA